MGTLEIILLVHPHDSLVSVIEGLEFLRIELRLQLLRRYRRLHNC
jgi:hypothetical protein